MKKSKALLALLLAVVMLSSMLMPAFAATPELMPTPAAQETTADTETVPEEVPQESPVDTPSEPSAEDVSATETALPLENALPKESALPTESTEPEGEPEKTSAADSVAVLEDNTASVAKIGETLYTTLDGAIAKAADGAVIEVLADCTTAGINLSKNLTIRAAEGLTAKPVITFTTDGIALWAKSLTFEGCSLVMNGIGSTPYGEWKWMAICGQAGSALKLIDSDMLLDGDPQHTGTRLDKHAIYADSGIQLSLERSNLTIKNYIQDALEWDGGNFDYNVVLKDSTYLSDNNRSGFTGTFKVLSENSKISVLNSSGNGSNGSHFYFKNSDVLFDNNGAHGLSTGTLSIENSTVTANHNGLCGVAVNASGDMFMDGTSTLTITNNCYETSTESSALRMYGGKRNAQIKRGAKVTITNNEASGIETYRPTVFEEGVALTVTNNRILISQSGGTDGQGGGIYTYRALTLPSDAVIYNNHALVGGDDIYCHPAEGKITFGKVGTDWKLDGAPDCEHAIDGWYDDADGSRWSAHKKPVHAQVFHEDEFDQATGLATVTGELSLKAAHAVSALPPVNPDLPDAPAWEVSKSKSATNLDQNFESRVTLSLPSAEENLMTDIVFVFDKSSCSEPVRKEVGKMLDQLYAHAKESGAGIKIGAVKFRGNAPEFALRELNDAAQNELTKFLTIPPMVGGSNMSMGLLAGEKMLDADTTVDNNRKYLILVSDGITYIWDDENTPEQENLGINFSNLDFPDKPFLASPDSWDVKHGHGYVPEDWNQELQQIRPLLADSIQQKSSVYKRHSDISQNPFVKPDEQSKFASSVDVALFKSYQAYQNISAKYHTFAVVSGRESDTTYYPYGPSFMKFLAGNKKVTFENIEKEILYLLDAGSKVEDVIGYGKDDKGNDYNMDFISDASKLSLTVGNTALAAEAIEVDPDAFFTEHKFETARFGFGKHEDGSYDYVIHYYANGKDGSSDECFVWDINVPVSNFAPVQLTYSVKLTNPQTVEGSYGVYDEFGTNHKAGLYTNASATLYPVDSNGQADVPELFEKPTVSYTVAAAPTPVPTPDSNVNPTPVPTPESTSTPAPAPTAAPQRPGNGTNTGDSTNMNLWFSLMTLCAMGAAGIWVISKKSR